MLPRGGGHACRIVPTDTLSPLVTKGYVFGFMTW